jgi:hypothetical protein
MKRNFILSLVAMLAVTVGLAYAGTLKSMIINVPFEFYVQDQLMPAGEYKFEMGSGTLSTASVVVVRTSEGEGIRFLLTRSETNKSSQWSHLRFNQYDEKHFLSSVLIGAYKANVGMSNLEKELRIASKTAQTETLVAQK